MLSPMVPYPVAQSEGLPPDPFAQRAMAYAASRRTLLRGRVQSVLGAEIQLCDEVGITLG